MNGDDWIQRVRGFGVAKVAELLGLTVERGSFRPCPVCVAKARGSTDKRGPVGLRPDGRGWRCHRCQADGDAVALVAARVLGKPKPEGPDDWAAVRAWCASAGLCEGRTAGAAPRVALRPLPAPRPPAPPVRVPPAELLALWNGATAPVSTVPEVAAFLARRKLDAAEVERRELARAIVAGERLPAWARFKGRPWTESGHRLLVGLYDARGELVSVQARSILADVPKGEKAGNPAPVLDEAATRAAGAEVWTRFQLGGAVMADARGLALLRGSFPIPREVWIAEGVPDFLTLGVRWPDAATAPAVLGIVEGAWRPELAARIPQGARVVVVTDHDANGDRYAQGIAATLAGRRVARHVQGRQTAPGAN